MKNYVLYFAILALTVTTSCGRRTVTGNGETVTVQRDPGGNFSVIDIEAPLTATIHVVPGAKSTVTFSGYKNLVDQIRLRTEGSTLVIESKHSIRFDTDKDVQADITVPSLSELLIDGKADAKIGGDITGDVFKLVISGAGDVSVEKLAVGKLEAKISGAGNVTLHSGTVGTAEYKVSGAGNIDGFGVQARHVKAKVSGAGDIDVFASETLEAKVSGAGTIQYKGAASVKSETSGIGTIVAAN